MLVGFDFAKIMNRLNSTNKIDPIFIHCTQLTVVSKREIDLLLDLVGYYSPLFLDLVSFGSDSSTRFFANRVSSLPVPLLTPLSSGP